MNLFVGFRDLFGRIFTLSVGLIALTRFVQKPQRSVKVRILVRALQKARELGGLVSGEHGIGYAKKVYLKEQLGNEQIALMQGIKKVFDEKNILNPNKVCF